MRFATILLATASLVDGFAPAGLGGARRRSALAATATGNPVIKAASAGMGLLKPIFSAEASLQAAALGGLAGVDEAEVVAEIEAAKKANPVLIYTYALSPFSTEALALLDSTGYEYETIELGLEWFTLGGRGSRTRAALASYGEGASSLPKIFIGGDAIGGASGYSALADAAASGELDTRLKKSRAKQLRR